MTDYLKLRAGTLRGCIGGPLPSMKNGRRIVSIRARGAMNARPLSIKSAAALAFVGKLERAYWEALAGRTIGAADFPLTGRLEIFAICYQRETKGPHRKDVDIELLCDALQAAGILADDWDLWTKSARRVIDENPRTEFQISRMSDMV